MFLLKQSTAATLHIGPAVDTDGQTPVTDLAAGTVDEIGVYKHDGTSLVDLSGTTTLTHRAGGMYTATLSTADTNTLGRARFYLRDDSACLPIWEDFMVIPAAAYDALVAGTAPFALEATLTAMKGAGWADETLKAIKDAVDTTTGAGASEQAITIKDGDGNPIADADVWITSDAAGTIVVYGTKQTDSDGHPDPQPMLDAGVTYYLWMQKDGCNPINGKEFEAE
jgi:hypothetical protein